MSDFDFMSIPKIALVLGVIILYLTVTIAIIKSLIFKRKSYTPYHTDFIFTESYKGIEKRRSERIPVDLKALVYNESKSLQHPTTIRNISNHGIRCEIHDQPFNFIPRDKVFIEIYEQGEMHSCKIPCKLVWKKGDDKFLTFGAEFTAKSENLENYILFLKKHRE